MSNLLLRAPTRTLGTVALVTLLLSSVGPAQLPLGPFGPNSVNWPIAAGGNGHIYEPVVAPGVTWTAANTAALAAGGYLVTVTSSSENLFVFGLVNAPAFWYMDTGPWLGGQQKPGSPEPGGGWTWVTGETFAYANWRPGEPNNGQPCGTGVGEVCIHYLLPYGAGGSFPLDPNNAVWNDCCADACGPPSSYVVEYDVELRCPCTPTGLCAENPPPNNVCAVGAFTLCLAPLSNGSARLQVFNLPAGTLFGKTLISAVPAFPVGSGPIFGLNFEPSLLFSILFAPYGFGDPLSWFVGDPGFSPAQPFFVPAGTMTSFAGETWDFVAMAFMTGATGLTYTLSNYIQMTWP